MHPGVACELGMEDRHHDRTLDHERRVPVDRREHPDLVADPLDDRCSDAHRLERRVQTLDLDLLDPELPTVAALEELGMLSKVRTPAPVLIAFFDKDRLDDYLRLAATLREAGIGVEVFPEPKKLGQQLQYADRRGFRVAIIAGEREFTAGRCQLKNLATTEASEASLQDPEQLIASVRALVS